MKRLNNIKGSAILCLAALIWGLAFVAQSQAADSVPPFIFNALRSFIGAAFLFLLLLILKIKNRAPLFGATPATRKEAMIGGVLCGTLLAVSVNLQQFGLAYYPDGVASEARAGFLTALYVILVPIVSVFFGKKIRLPVWGAVLIATVGIYLLSLSEGIHNVYMGDVLVFLCAISFTFHILVVDRYGEPVGGILLSMLQFLVCGIISLVLSLIFELDAIAFDKILAAAPQILYLGIMSSGIAYTLQIVGQRYADPPIASITMSLESVFAALGGWLIMENTLLPKELLGCSLVFAAIILAQIPQFFSKGKKKPAETIE